MTIIQKNSKFVKEGEGVVTRLYKIEATKNYWWKKVKIGISAIKFKEASKILWTVPNSHLPTFIMYT